MMQHDWKAMFGSFLYLLDINKKLVPTDDVVEWAKMMGGRDRIIAQTNVEGAMVSTVFLGVNHGFMRTGPICFETMRFDFPEEYDLCERYATWEEAERGHWEVVNDTRDYFFFPRYTGTCAYFALIATVLITFS